LRRRSSIDPASIRVLHVTQPGEEGVAFVVTDLARDQVERGYDVVVAGPPNGDFARAIEATGARLVPWQARRQPGPSVIAETRALSRILAAERPQLVHLHSSKAGLVGRLALRGRLPTLFQPHSWSFEALRGPLRRAAAAWERRAARWTSTIVCVSEAEREHGERVGVSGNFRVVPNGIDLDAFREAADEERAAARARLGLGEGPLVVCVGRLCRQKGQDVLVGAWPSVRARVPEARLVLVGGGPSEQELRRAAGEGVELVGTRQDVPDWLAAADVIAAPSRWDGMSLAVLEAMARGRSVVATDVPGAREALGDAGAIVSVEAGDELAGAIVERLSDPELAAAEGRKARSRSELHHDVRATCGRIAELYVETVGR
jgi:glycosyltransferase involved in cell wall biosynthesis